MNSLYARRADEQFDDYFVRLFENKTKYGLSCQDIADILNAEAGSVYGESKWRKEYAAFNRGRQYERNGSVLGVKTRILSISDSHVPFNLPANIFSQYSGIVDILIFNGDIEDAQNCSIFPRKYRVPLNEEMVATREYMCDVIDIVRPKKVIITKGNHEERLGRLLSDKLSDDIFAIMPDTPLDLIVNDGFTVKDRKEKTKIYYPPLKEVYKEEGIDVVYNGNWFEKVGHTIFAHPLAYSSGMLKTSNKAVDYFLRVDRDFNAIVLGHTHKVGTYVQGGIKLYEQGCCCDLQKVDYANGKLVIPNQNGYIYLCQDKDGNVVDGVTKIVNF